MTTKNQLQRFIEVVRDQINEPHEFPLKTRLVALRVDVKGDVLSMEDVTAVLLDEDLSSEMLLDAIHDVYQQQHGKVIRSTIAAVLEALNMPGITIDTNKLPTIWDRVDLSLITADGQPGIQNYVLANPKVTA